MKCYNKYIIKNLAAPCAGITLTITAIIWLMQSLRILKLIATENLDFLSFFYLSLLNIPSLLFIILPVTGFVATIFTYNRLINDSEIVILQSSGLSKFALAKPAIIVAISLAMFNFIIAFYLLPFANTKFKEQKIFMRDNYLSVMLQEGVFNTPMNNLTFYIDSKSANGELNGIFIQQTGDQSFSLMAKNGKLVKTDNGLSLDLYHGNKQEIDKDGELQVLFFEFLSYYFSREAPLATTQIKSASERYISELFDPKDVDPRKIIKYKSEGHMRISWPMQTISLTLIALIAMLSGAYNRRINWQKYCFASLAAIIMVITSLAIASLTTAYPQFTFLIYLNIVMTITGLLYVLVARV